MDFDIKKRTGFLVNFALLLVSKTPAKDKEVPIHVYEHTLFRLGSAMPIACIHPAVLSDTHRGAARLGDVSEQADRVPSVPNDPGQYARFSQRAASFDLHWVYPLHVIMAGLLIPGHSAVFRYPEPFIQAGRPDNSVFWEHIHP